MNFRRWALLVLILNSGLAKAQSLAFTSLTDDQAKSIVKEFSANFTQTSVSGASPLGSVFGLEFGLLGGVTKTPEIGTLVKAADPSAKADQIPNANVLVMFSIPLGLTFEGNFVPKIGGDSFKFANMGLGVKWSLTSGLLDLPFSLAVKGHYMKTDLEFKQTVSSVVANVKFDDSVYGATLLISKNLLLVEPYLGIGMVSGKGNFDVQGTTAFFASGVTSYSASSSGTQFIAGAEFKLLLFHLGAEYSKLFDTSRYNAKLSFSF